MKTLTAKFPRDAVAAPLGEVLTAGKLTNPDSTDAGRVTGKEFVSAWNILYQGKPNLVPDPFWYQSLQRFADYKKISAADGAEPTSFEVEIAHWANVRQSVKISLTSADWATWQESGFFGSPAKWIRQTVEGMELTLAIAKSVDNVFTFQVQSTPDASKPMNMLMGGYRGIKINGISVMLNRDEVLRRLAMP